MNVFLKAKHWQLFVVTFGLPIVFVIVMMANIFSTMMQNPNPDPTAIFGFFKFYPIITLLYMGVLYGWHWSVAMGLRKFLPAGTDLKTTRFKVFFFVPVVYMTLIMIGLVFLFTTVLGSGFNPQNFVNGPADPSLFLIGFAVFFPLHLFSMFCIFYCFYFIAKTIKTVELQREATFGDFVLEFFLIWFFPVGVWILQPKINRMVEQNDDQQFLPDQPAVS